MWQPEDLAITKMCPKRSQFAGTEQSCVAVRCMAWRREGEEDAAGSTGHTRNRNTGVAYGYCSEYPEPKIHNTRKA